MATNGNPYNYPHALLVEVQYIQSDKHTRMLKGDVTGKGWGRWKYGQKGVIHIADAIMFVKRRVVRPVDTQDYIAKEAALGRGNVTREDISPDKPLPRSLNVEAINYVGKHTAQRFSDAGINTVQAVADLSPAEIVALVALPHVNEVRAKAIIADAKEILKSNDL